MICKNPCFGEGFFSIFLFTPQTYELITTIPNYFLYFCYMSAVSLILAKQYMRLDPDYTAEDELIQLMIDASENMVEVYTSHVLVQRDYTLIGAGCEQDIYLYPITDIAEGVKYHNHALYTSFDLRRDVSTTFKVGYANYEHIPKQLITAVLKQVTYMYENRDIYEAALHTDVKAMINQLRRGIVVV